MTLFKWTWRFIKTAKTLIFLTLFLLSFGLNIAQFTGGVISGIASTAFHAVTGKRSVAAQHALTVADINKRLDTEKATKRKLSKQHTLAVADINKKLDVEKRVNHDLQKKLKNSNTRIVKYKGKKMALNEAVEATSDSISRRSKKTAIREIGSMGGEALPWIGTAVIVSMTALELKDLCDTLKDMNALKAAFDPKLKPNNEETTVCAMKPPSRKELTEMAKNSPEKAWSLAKAALLAAKTNTPTVDDIKSYELPDINWNEYLGKSTDTVNEWKDSAAEGAQGLWDWWTTDESDKAKND